MAIVAFDTDAAIDRAQQPMELHQPLYRELKPPLEFPLDALGELRGAAEAIQAITQAPIGLCAQSVLAAATVIAQGIWDVNLPRVGQRPISCFFLSKAVSGERKSTV